MSKNRRVVPNESLNGKLVASSFSQEEGCSFDYKKWADGTSREELRFEDSTEVRNRFADGFYCESVFDSLDNEIRYSDNEGYWEKREYDSNGNEVFYENSEGEKVGASIGESKLCLDVGLLIKDAFERSEERVTMPKEKAQKMIENVLSIVNAKNNKEIEL